jgi:hypothetical protein
MIRVGIALVACVSIFATVARAQETQRHFTVGVTAAQQIVQSMIEPSKSRFTGPVLGIEGGMVSDRLQLRVQYLEGRVSPASGTTDSARDVVEGQALVGFRALPWLTLWGGPSARAYTIGSANQRWIIWTVRATGRGTIVPGRVNSFVELYSAFSGSVGDPALPAGGRGLNGGLELRASASGMFWGRLGYRVESARANGLRETVETFSLSFIYGLPQ